MYACDQWSIIRSAEHRLFQYSSIPKTFIKKWFIKNDDGYLIRKDKQEEFIQKHVLIKKQKKFNKDDFTDERQNIKKLLTVKSILDPELFAKVMVSVAPNHSYEIFLKDIPFHTSVGISPVNCNNPFFEKQLKADVFDSKNKIAVECGHTHKKKLEAWSALGYKTYWLNYKNELYLYETGELRKIQELVG